MVNLPDKTGREAILKVHTRHVPLARGRRSRRARLDHARVSRRGPAQPGQRGGAARGAARTGRGPPEGFPGRAREDRPRARSARCCCSRAERERIAYHEGGHAILGPGRARRRSREPRDDRAARPGARRHLSAPGERPLQLPRGLPARAHRRHARRTRGRGARLRHAHHGCGERHRAGDPDRAQDGHALGHERRARAGTAGAARRTRIWAAGTSRPTGRSATRPRA